MQNEVNKWRWLKVAITAATLVFTPLQVLGGTAATREAGFVATSREGMVASDSPWASQAGAEILRDGGNAIDAAVATSLALAVTRPASTGLGGGGFFVIRLAVGGQVVALDCRERAPGAATADMFIKARERDPEASPPSRHGGLAIGVPGLLAGHAAVLQRYGTCDWKAVVAPALRLARKGFAVDEHHCGTVRGMKQDTESSPRLREVSAELRRLFLAEDTVPKPGELFKHPDLARTLKLIADGGADAFYRGPVADAIVASVRDAGGVITHDDLTGYAVTWREPLRARYRERHEVISMPPPSSGGVCLIETLNILEHWNLRTVHDRDPGLAVHLTVEALKHAFADRARHLGDADFADVPVARLVSKAYAAELSGRIREDGVAQVASYGTPLPDDAGTSHYCVADRWGNVVSATETINTGFGSYVVAKGFGIVLNNEMDDFTAEPDKMNAFGLLQSDRNAVAAGKRPLSSMSPTIVLEDGRPVLAVGGSGGPRIITATLQVLLKVIEYGLEPGEAVEGPRFHHQWQPDVVHRNEYPADHPVIQRLSQLGHVISDQRRGAVVQALAIGDGGFTGVSDPRKGGRPAGP